MGGTFVLILIAVGVSFVIPPAAALALPFALLCYFLAWGKSILDAYNSHDDNADKLFEEAKAAAGDKAA
jgi:hypothetical protein